MNARSVQKPRQAAVTPGAVSGASSRQSGPTRDREGMELICHGIAGYGKGYPMVHTYETERVVG